MNEEALKKTIETKEAHYWSRSRKEVWHKGETSGFVQKVVELRIDDDQDSIWMTEILVMALVAMLDISLVFIDQYPLEKLKIVKK